MKDSGDVLEIEDEHGTTHTEKLVRERSGHVHNQLDFFSSFDPFMGARETKIVDVRSSTVCEVSHSSWCGNFDARFSCEKHGVAVLHSSSTTLTMTRTFGQVL